MTWLTVLPYLLGAFAIAVGLGAATHALLWKRDPRSAMGWILLTAFFPVFGAGLYWLFGVNRIETRARRLDERSGYVLGSARHHSTRTRRDRRALPVSGRPEVFEARDEELALLPREFRELASISRAVTGWPLMPGHRLRWLRNGDEAYPVMLQAIAAARHRVVLCTYIFDGFGVGRRFVEALVAAHERGVDVRVLIDGVGEFYSWPRARPALEAVGIPVTRFLPPALLPPNFSFNLRTHRKILVVDGYIGFTGGINLRQNHLLVDQPPGQGVADVHFQFEGPAAISMERVFLDDWAFMGGGDPGRPEPCEPSAELARLRPSPQDDGNAGALCRLVVDGPNEDLDKLITILVGAVSAARQRVAIMTPYFLPTRALTAALQAAALRGVEVLVVLPERSNLPFVDWATRNVLWELLQRGVRVALQPPPFAHSKLFVIDGHYALVGSANLDPRSLRLNFELCVEIYHRSFAAELDAHIDAAAAAGRDVTLHELDQRSYRERLRDAVFWLFSPYL